MNLSTKRAATRRAGRSLIAALLTCALGLAGPWPAVAGQTQDSQAEQAGFSDEELEELLGPIALYPDPLLAQVLPAATFVDQLDEASRLLGGKVNEEVIQAQEWDISVKAVAHYPQVRDRMVQNREWTIALGQAVVNQSTDTMKAVQRLRAQAKAAGNLQSGEQMKVVEEQQVIRIEPAQPQVIYVPQYNPQVVYVKDEGPSTGETIAAGIIGFGAGLALGAWLNRDCDWHRWGFPYHGWRPGLGGWIGRSRVHIHISVRNYYINDRWRPVHYNRSVLRRDITTYRTTLRQGTVARRDRSLRPDRANPVRPSTRDTRVDALRNQDRSQRNKFRGYETRPSPAQRPTSPAPSPGMRPSPPSRPMPSTRPTPRPSPSPRPSARPSSRESNRSVFRGSGNGAEVRKQSNRGRDSRSTARARTSSPRPSSRRRR